MRILFWKASDWLMAETGLLRSTDASAAESVA